MEALTEPRNPVKPVRCFKPFPVACVLTLLFAAAGCKQHPNRHEFLEVAPGEFVEIEWPVPPEFAVPRASKNVNQALNILARRDSIHPGSCWVHWQGKRIPWENNLHLLAFRAHQGKLYVAAWQTVLNKRKSQMPETRCRYYAYDGDRFKETDRTAFPKALAVQNIDFFPRYFMTDRQRDEAQIARDLDPSDPNFRRSLTARLWCNLETGKQLHESPHEIDQKFLEEFLYKYQPAKLTMANYFLSTNSLIQSNVIRLANDLIQTNYTILTNQMKKE